VSLDSLDFTPAVIHAIPVVFIPGTHSRAHFLLLSSLTRDCWPMRVGGS